MNLFLFVLSLGLCSNLRVMFEGVLVTHRKNGGLVVRCCFLACFPDLSSADSGHPVCGV